MTTMADIVKQEAIDLENRTGKFVYSSQPYSCAMEECLSYFKKYDIPKKDQMTIERGESLTTINLKPLKGSGKRKVFTIKLWV